MREDADSVHGRHQRYAFVIGYDAAYYALLQFGSTRQRIGNYLSIRKNTSVHADNTAEGGIAYGRGRQNGFEVSGGGQQEAFFAYLADKSADCRMVITVNGQRTVFENEVVHRFAVRTSLDGAVVKSHERARDYLSVPIARNLASFIVQGNFAYVEDGSDLAAFVQLARNAAQIDVFGGNLGAYDGAFQFKVQDLAAYFSKETYAYLFSDERGRAIGGGSDSVIGNGMSVAVEDTRVRRVSSVFRKTPRSPNGAV